MLKLDIKVEKTSEFRRAVNLAAKHQRNLGH